MSTAFEDFFQRVSPLIPRNPDLTNVPDVGEVRGIPEFPRSLTLSPRSETFNREEQFEILQIESQELVSKRIQEIEISAEEAAVFNGRIRTEGFDCLAFYKSRRLRETGPCPGRWGIFYLDRGVRYLSDLVRASVPGLASGIIPPPQRYSVAPTFSNTHEWSYLFLRAHERYHFWFDVYALGVEAIARRAFYEPLSHAFRDYPSHLVEEALANAAALRWARGGNNNRAGLATFARDYLRLQPHAYGRFQEPVDELRAELAANLLDLDLTPSARRHDQEWWVARIAPTLMECPEHLIFTATRSPKVRPSLSIPSVKKVLDTKDVTKYLKNKPSLRNKLKATKKKLCSNPSAIGLNFKPWDDSHREWSVKIDKGKRAHLFQIDANNAIWEVIKIGTHKETGHG